MDDVLVVGYARCCDTHRLVFDLSPSAPISDKRCDQFLEEVLAMSDSTCPFCNPHATRQFYVGELILGLWDAYPVNPGHALLVTKRHVASWFDATDDERSELLAAVEIARRAIEGRGEQPDGFNIGVNVGEAAGQTVGHLHLHVIPRREGDVADPRGGVRHVIPGRANYLIGENPFDDSGIAEERGPVPAELGITSDNAESASRLFDTGLPHARSLIAGGDDALLPHLRTHLDYANRADLAVAFVLESGLDQIDGHLFDLVERGGNLRVLSGDYLGVTDPRALRRLLDLRNAFPEQVQIRVMEVPARSSFHPKAYIFETKPGDGIAIIGSSNLTATGLTHGIEWSYRAVTSRDATSYREVVEGYAALFHSESTAALSDSWIDAYESRRLTLRSAPAREIAPVDETPPPVPEPHGIQREALAALEATRLEGFGAGLVVLATGLGKTWLAAFDTDREEFGKVLFVAHREEILRQSLATFRTIRPTAKLGLYMGVEQTPDADVVFASIQTLGSASHLERFAADRFDYIVVDEFHHASAPTYTRLIRYFKPAFLLGLTATPDRLDGSDILQLCEDNLVFECDAPGGIKQGLLSPFSYFGIPDEVDYREIPWRNSRFAAEKLTQAVETQKRGEHVYQQWLERGGQRTLAFCCSITHADFMRDYFLQKGISAASVHSGSASHPRTRSLERLNSGELKVIFTVDIFNEGVDIPLVDTVMMLRPTESPVIWMQQFGRGLRRAEGKERLTVLDYIGNHRIFLMKIQTLFSLEPGDHHVAFALNQLEAGNLALPEGCEVNFDLGVVDILRALLRGPGPGPVLVEQWYRDFHERRGERPTAGQAVRAGYNPAVMRAPYGSWLGFVDAMGGLESEQSILLKEKGCGEFLGHLETTPMTKSYKMLVLRALLDESALTTGLSIEQITAGVSRQAATSPRVQEDLGVEVTDFVALRRKLEQNPIKAWCGGAGTGGRPYFAVEDGHFVPTSELECDNPDALAALVTEIVDWRLTQYFRRASSPDSGHRFLCRVSHTRGKPIIRLPNRDKEPGVPAGWVPILAKGERFEANFVKIAVNLIHREGNTKNVLPEIARGWFGEHAGLPSTNHWVEIEYDGVEWEIRPLLGEGGESSD